MTTIDKIDELIDIVKVLLIVQLLEKGLSQADVREIAKVGSSTISEIAKKLPKKQIINHEGNLMTTEKQYICLLNWLINNKFKKPARLLK